MSASGIRLSVIICTHNRSRDLDAALASLEAQSLDRDLFEVIVVDNGSTDQTSDVVRARGRRAPVRYLLEPTVGLCVARNTGWRAAAAPIVAYLDDDALASDRWAAELLGAFDDLEVHPGCVGGSVEPIFGAPPPLWMSDEVALSLTIVRWGPTSHLITDLGREWLVGANIAFRKDVLAAVGGFPPELDRVGSRMLSGGDVYVQRLIMEAGDSCMYVPGAAVRHQVPKERLRKAWFIRRFYWQGESDAIMEILHDRLSGPERRRRGIRRLVALALSAKALARLVLPSGNPERFAKKCWTWIALGHAVGLLRAR